MDFKKTQPTCFTQVRGTASEKVPGKNCHWSVTIQPSRHGCTLTPPGLAAMADNLHEKTALLPRINKIHEIKTSIGKSTGEAMLAGAVHG
jgi:hypothetical protein